MMTSVVRGLPHALMSRRSHHCRDSSTDINEEILVYGDDESPFMSAGPGVSDGTMEAVEKHADSVHVSLGTQA